MKKQLIHTGCLYLLLALIKASVPVSSLATGIGDYTVIRSAADLQEVANNMASNYVLDADLDLSSIPNFLPIGSTAANSAAVPAPFTGTLDGGGHIISGLTQESGSRFLGLFGVIGSSGSVKNLALTNSSITSSYAGGAVSSGGTTPGMVGVLAGLNDGGSIENVVISGTLTETGSGNAIGGLTGVNKGSITNVLSTVAVSASIADSAIGVQALTNPIGGLVGWNTGTIKNVVVSGNVDVNLTANLSAGALSGAQIGGLAGLSNNGGVVVDSSAGGNVTAAFAGRSDGQSQTGVRTLYVNLVGGLIGNIDTAGSISNSSARGAVKVTSTAQWFSGGLIKQYVGGLLASGGTDWQGVVSKAGTPTISYSSASGLVSVAAQSSSLIAGGLVGPYSGSIALSRATGNIHVEGGNFNAIGGLVGTFIAGSITDASSSGHITSLNNGIGVDIGGIAGTSGGDIISTTAIGNVTSTMDISVPNFGMTDEGSTIGGLVGYNYGRVENCHASGTVTGIFAGSSNGKESRYADQVAGLVANSIGLISNSSASGSVIVQSTVVTLNGGYASKMVGGLVGGAFVCCGGSSRILNSYSTGNVTATAKDDILFVAGLIGYNSGSVASTYAIGPVTVSGGTEKIVGSLVGRNDNSGVIAAGYWDANTSGTNIGVGSGSTTGVVSWSGPPLTLPGQFDPAIWRLAVGINGGYPWLVHGGMTQLNIAAAEGGAGSATTVGVPYPLRSGYAAVAVNAGNPPYGAAVFSLTQGSVVVSEVGVPATIPSTATRIFVELRSGVSTGQGRVDVSTGMAVVNTGSATASVTYTLRDTSGKTLATGHGALAARSHFARFIDQLSTIAQDFNLPANFASAVQYGSLDITSNQPLAVLALRLSINQRGETFLTSTPIADLSAAFANGPLNFPQLADGGGYVSSIVLLNTSGASESGRLVFHADNGSPLLVGHTGGTKASSFPYTIQPGGVFLFQTDGSPEGVHVGWVQVIPDANTTSPVGAGIFSYTRDGVLVTESGVPAAVPTSHARIFVDQSGGHSTGLALANPGSSNLAVTLKAYQTDGTTEAGTSSGPITLSGSGHAAGFISQLISGLPAGFTGVLDISSPTPIVALTLRALVNSRGDFLLTTFPIADLTRPAPAPMFSLKLRTAVGM